MPEHEMSEAERKAISKMNSFLNQYMQGILGDEHEHGHSKRADPNRYIYWEAPDQRMFCYTPWKDENGYYYTWVLKPHGRGAKSGNAQHWKRVGKVVLSRTRKTARKRARTRYKNWLKYLNQEWRNE